MRCSRLTDLPVIGQGEAHDGPHPRVVRVGEGVASGLRGRGAQRGEDFGGQERAVEAFEVPDAQPEHLDHLVQVDVDGLEARRSRRSRTWRRPPSP